MNSAFVGRQTELSRLAQKVRSSRDGRGLLVTISGEAGIGKTRLMSEIARIATDSGSNVLWGQMIEDPVAPPYTVWTLALRSYLQQIDDDTLLDDLGSDAIHVADILPELRERLSLGTSQPPVGNEAAARYQLFECVSRLLLAVAKRQPLVLLFDNLHLADESSLLLLKHYAHQVAGSRSLIIAAHRDGADASGGSFHGSLTSLGRIAEAEQMTLSGLDRGDVAQLLRNATGAAPSPTLADAVYTRGGGNPLFTCQVAKSLASQETGTSGLPPDSLFEIPHSLSEAIASRFALVDRDVLDVLGKAAVLGRDFDLTLLAELCKQDAAEILKLIDEACNAQIVVRVATRRYRFDHALFRESLYAKQSLTDRLRLHHLAATKLSARYGDDLDPPVAQLAYHWFEASCSVYDPQAVDWCRRAADVAIAKRAYGEASAQAERALALIDMAPEDDPELRFDLLCTMGSARFQAGQQDLSNQAFLQATLIAHRNEWPRRLAESVLRWNYVQVGQGFVHEKAVAFHHAALKTLPVSDIATRTRIMASLAPLYWRQSNHELALETMHESIKLARDIGDPGVLFDSLIAAFNLAVRAYDAPMRLPILEEALQVAPSTGREENVLVATAALLFPLMDLGRFDVVRRHVADLTKRANASRHLYWQQVAAGFQVSLALLSGRWDDAMRVAQSSLQDESFRGTDGIKGRFGFQMFTVHRALGTLSTAAPLLLKIAASDTESRTWLPGRILLHCELGQRQEALDALAQLGDLKDLTTGDLYETTLVYVAEACAILGDRARCQELYELLKPYRGVFLNMTATLSHGAASGHLGMLAASLQRTSEARKLFEETLEQYEACVAPVFQARTQCNFAALLLKSKAPADTARATQLLNKAMKTAKRLKLRPLVKRIDELASGMDKRNTLTNREVAVLNLLANGDSNQRIADKLCISHSTVATHVRHILRKTASKNRTEAVAYARKSALLPSS